ncbi:FRG domain-containing protein [Dermabacteraceae bacterium TAE3-ERU5]|nr:FRG domain-containing protein [Dermabacteraceae bacterium TAE3-ERU5]
MSKELTLKEFLEWVEYRPKNGKLTINTADEWVEKAVQAREFSSKDATPPESAGVNPFCGEDLFASLLPLHWGREEGAEEAPQARISSAIKYVYRGQSNSTWGLTSSLFRDLKKTSKEFCTEYAHEYRGRNARRILKEAEDETIKKARRNGLGRNMGDFELLATLQHEGVPTSLLDITTDPLVALYFACKGEESEDGRMFVLAIKSWDEIGEDESSTLLPQKEGSNIVRAVNPRETCPKMIAQKGRFLSGRLVAGTVYQLGPKIHNGNPTPKVNLRAKESKELTNFDIRFLHGGERRLTEKKNKPDKEQRGAYCITFKIPQVHKNPILEILKDGHGICKDSLLPDYSKLQTHTHF